MIVCLDVDYREGGAAKAAAIAFARWDAADVSAQWVAHVPHVAPYEPGAFYRRELPCLLAVLEAAACPFDVVVVDAYVTLDDQGKPGLGGHLHAALGGATPVVGVAKRPYAGATTAVPVRRGSSATPLWVSALGVDVDVAAAAVRGMHGDYRIPTQLRRVDRLARDA